MLNRKIITLCALITLLFSKSFGQTVNYTFKLNHGGVIRISNCRTLDVKFVTSDSVICLKKELTDSKKNSNKDSTYVLELLDSLVSIQFFETRGDKFCFSHNLPNLLIEKCNPNFIEIGFYDTTSFHDLIIKNSKIEKVSIRRSIISGVLKIFQEDKPPLPIDTIEVSNCKFLKTVRLGLIELPKFIRLENIEFASIDSEFDLTNITDTIGYACNLEISGLYNNISNLKINYEYFNLVFNGATYPQMENIYYQLLETQHNLGYNGGYGKLDRKFKEFEYSRKSYGELRNFIDREWWNYGYNKQRVVKWSLKIFLLFLGLNLFLYPRFIKIYCPDKFKRAEERLKSNVPPTRHTNIRLCLKRIPVLIVYTAYLFWGLKLDVKEIEIKGGWHYFFLSLLFFEYVIGIICVAYIANFIITR